MKIKAELTKTTWLTLYLSDGRKMDTSVRDRSQETAENAMRGLLDFPEMCVSYSFHDTFLLEAKHRGEQLRAEDAAKHNVQMTHFGEETDKEKLRERLSRSLAPEQLLTLDQILKNTPRHIFDPFGRFKDIGPEDIVIPRGRYRMKTYRGKQGIYEFSTKEAALDFLRELSMRNEPVDVLMNDGCIHTENISFKRTIGSVFGTLRSGSIDTMRIGDFSADKAPLRIEMNAVMADTPNLEIVADLYFRPKGQARLACRSQRGLVLDPQMMYDVAEKYASSKK